MNISVAAFGAVVATASIVWLEKRRRHREWLNGPNHRAQIEAWYAQEPIGKEPVIPPLALPPVKPLKAEPASVSRFKRTRQRKAS